MNPESLLIGKDKSILVFLNFIILLYCFFFFQHTVFGKMTMVGCQGGVDRKEGGWEEVGEWKENYAHG